MSDTKEAGIAADTMATIESGEGRIIDTEDKGLDVAAGFAAYLGDEGYSAKEERRLRWKVDFRLIPILWLNICFGAMDKVSTSTAALYGMREDTGLTGDKYSWVGSVFYVRITHYPCPADAEANYRQPSSLATCSGVFLPRRCCNVSQLPRPCAASKSSGVSS